MERDYQCKGCGRAVNFRQETEEIFDCHGIYAGRLCFGCADSENPGKLLGLNLNYTYQDAAENGERIDDDY